MKSILKFILLAVLVGISFSNTAQNSTLSVNQSETVFQFNETEEPLHIYLLRGLTRESGHWGGFIDTLRKDLPENAVIHLLDLPGAGKYVNQKAFFKASKMVDFMRADIIDTLMQNKNNIMCATSLGGILAHDWVTRYKDDFQGLIMINSSFKTICNRQERAQKAVRMDLIKILITSNIEKREGMIIKVNSNRPELFAGLKKDWSKIQKKRRMTRMNIFKQSMSGLFYNFRGKKPELPLLIIGSRGDRMVCSKCIQKTHKVFGGTIVWHPTAGHGLPIDAPEWLSTQISDWCASTYKIEQGFDEIQLALNQTGDITINDSSWSTEF